MKLKDPISRPNSDRPITEAGGTINGPLTLSQTPTQPTSVVNKQYVDTMVSGCAVTPGDVLLRFSSVTPTGFLRCNGGLVSKTLYPDLYNIIGDNFDSTAYPGNGQPWRHQYFINTTLSTNLDGWVTGTTLPGASACGRVAVTKNRIYYLGRLNGNTYTGTVYTAPINASGVIGTWSTGTSLPIVMTYSQLIVVKNRLYIIGGYDGTNYLSSVYYANINADGTLGSWIASVSLPATVSHSQAILTKDRIYLMGGYNAGTPSSVVYTAVVNNDGSLGTWMTDLSLPISVYGHSASYIGSKIYIFGGMVNGSPSNLVYHGHLTSDGTLFEWMQDTSIPVTIYNSQVVTSANRVYLLGGMISGSSSNVVYASMIVGGEITTWAQSGTLLDTSQSSQCAVTSNKIYLIGGYKTTNAINNTYMIDKTGGLNDYSSYYSGVMSTVDPTLFRLPDYTEDEEKGIYHYVKY